MYKAIILTLSITLFIKCKDHKLNPEVGKCYSDSVKNAVMNLPCPHDAPGYCGCNGISYTNQCEARKKGIISGDWGYCK